MHIVNRCHRQTGRAGAATRLFCPITRQTAISLPGHARTPPGCASPDRVRARTRSAATCYGMQAPCKHASNGLAISRARLH